MKTTIITCPSCDTYQFDIPTEIPSGEILDLEGYICQECGYSLTYDDISPADSNTVAEFPLPPEENE